MAIRKSTREGSNGEAPKRKKRWVPPPDTYSVGDIERMTHVTQRTLLNWVKVGLVPKPAFHGRSTRYTRLHLAHVLAAKKLRGDYFSIDHIRDRFANLSTEQIEQIGGLPPLQAPVSAMPPAPPPAPEGQSPHAGPEAIAPAAAPPNDPVEPTYPRERFEHIQLMPGLEIVVRDQPLLRRIAQLIYDQFHA